MKQFTVIIVFFVVLLSGFRQGQAQPTVVEMKAIYIKKISQLIDWPSGSLVNETLVPFVICVVGNSELYSELSEKYENEKIKNKRVMVYRAKTINEISDCNVMFISEDQEDVLDKILEFTFDKPILTISDTPGFAEEGVLFNYYLTERNTLRFEINQTAAKTSSLNISYQLYELAKIVNPINK